MNGLPHDPPLPPPPPPPPSSSYHSISLKLWDLRHLLHDYRGWITRNPGKASDVESFFKVLAYLLPGRLRGNSTLLPELLYSTANVVTFWHDQILQRELERRASPPSSPSPPPRGGRPNGTIPACDTCPTHGGQRGKHVFRLQVTLNILEYFEVFLEVAARKLWGDAGRWIIIFVMQTIKAVLRAILVFYFRVGLSRSPALVPFNRTTYRPSQPPPSSQVFILPHSGRAVRKLHCTPPHHSRTWKLPEPSPNTPPPPRPLPLPHALAEIIHISRPLCHLLSLGVCGTGSWKPWIVSLAMDLGSLYLHGDPAGRNARDSVELNRRTLGLLLYLLRSPFYDQVTKDRLLGSLEGVGGRIPVVGHLFKLLAGALPQWQSTYSYVWS